MPVAKRGGALQPRDANTVHDNPALAHFYRKRELSALTDTCGTLYTRPVQQAHAAHARSRFDIFTECDDESVRDPDELSSVASTPAATPRPATPRRRRSSRATPRPTPARYSDVCSPDLLAEAAAALAAAGATGATPPSSALRLSSQSSQGTPRAHRDCPSPFIVSKRRRLGSDSGSPRAGGSPYSNSPIQPAGCPYDLGDYVKYRCDEEAWHVGLVSQVSELSFVIVLDDKSERTLSCVSEETSCRVRPHRAAVGCEPLAPPALSP